MLELVWTARFEADVQEIYEWLDDRSDGGADRFYRRLLADLEQLVHRPWSGSGIKHSNARQLLVVGLRYAAIYCVEPRRIMLQVLFDQRRDPALLAARIREITGGLPVPPP